MEKALFNWPVMLQYNVKAKYRLIPGKFSGKKFFQPQAGHARLYPFGKSLYFRSFVVSVLFPRFHFKLIRLSLYKGGKVYESPTTSLKGSWNHCWSIRMFTGFKICNLKLFSGNLE